MEIKPLPQETLDVVEHVPNMTACVEIKPTIGLLPQVLETNNTYADDHYMHFAEYRSVEAEVLPTLSLQCETSCEPHIQKNVPERCSGHNHNVVKSVPPVHLCTCLKSEPQD